MHVLRERREDLLQAGLCQVRPARARAQLLPAGGRGCPRRLIRAPRLGEKATPNSARGPPCASGPANSPRAGPRKLPVGHKASWARVPGAGCSPGGEAGLRLLADTNRALGPQAVRHQVRQVPGGLQQQRSCDAGAGQRLSHRVLPLLRVQPPAAARR